MAAAGKHRFPRERSRKSMALEGTDSTAMLLIEVFMHRPYRPI